MTDTTTTFFLTKGSHVEINSDEDSINGTWYSATVLHPPSTTRNQLVYVEYYNLSETNSTTRLRDYANISYVRPSPVPDTNNPPNFQLNDVVDAFYRDGWWTGIITTVIDADNFVVTFQNPPDQARLC
ncbi:putative Agenet-like domain-containing protein [Helianthus debilis subsp. tardiflorus]